MILVTNSASEIRASLLEVKLELVIFSLSPVGNRAQEFLALVTSVRPEANSNKLL